MIFQKSVYRKLFPRLATHALAKNPMLSTTCKRPQNYLELFSLSNLIAVFSEILDMLDISVSLGTLNTSQNLTLSVKFPGIV